MFGSLKQFIEVQFPQINPKLSTQQNQEQHIQTNDEVSKRRAKSNIQQYSPADKSSLLAKFNKRNESQNKNNSNLAQTRGYKSQSKQKLYEHSSFFGKNQITKDYIAKSELKRKHNLLRAIIRTNQNSNQNQGASDYDQSFKRLYQKFKSIYAKPILQYRNFVIDQKDHQLPKHSNVQFNKKIVNTINNKKRIQYESCLSWARKHKKAGSFYEAQLGKSQKQQQQQSLNMGHVMMQQVQKKLKTLNIN